MLVLFLLCLFSIVFSKSIALVYSYHETFGNVIDDDEGSVFGLVQEGYMENVNLIIHRFYMDTKITNTQPSQKEQISSEIISQLNELGNEIEVVCTFDDDAFYYVGLRITDYPVVFAGLNGLPEYYNSTTDNHFLNSRETPGHNISGVYEKIFINEAMNVVSLIIPELITSGKKILSLHDNSTTSYFMKMQIQNELSESDFSSEHNFTFEYRNVYTFQELQTVISEEVNTDDSIIATYAAALSLYDEHKDCYVTSDVIFDWMGKHSSKPDLSPGPSFTREGILGGCGSDHWDMGLKLGVKVGKILNGEFVGDIPISEPIFAIFINKDRVKTLGLENDVPSSFYSYCNYVFESDDDDNDQSTLNTISLVISVIVVMILVVFIISLAICVCGCCLIVICGGIFTGISYHQRRKYRMIGKKDLDRFLIEMKEAQRKSVPHIEILKDLFQVNYKDIRLLGVLGKGGQNCVVYKAKWRGKIVAYKSFRTTSFSDNSNFKEFENETQMHSSLFHPCLIGYYGSVIEKKRLGIVIEYCEMGDIMNYMSDKLLLEEKIPLQLKLDWLLQSSQAMSYLHSKNIIHRDFKPKNVLLTKLLNIKLIDFGLSKMLNSDSMHQTTKVGTSIYMAPEIFLGKRYGLMADVFSFGIFMYEIIEETFDPYNVKNNEEMYSLQMKLANDPKFRPELDFSKFEEKEGELKWLQELVVKCWSADPEKRIPFSEIEQILSDKKSKNM